MASVRVRRPFRVRSLAYVRGLAARPRALAFAAGLASLTLLEAAWKEAEEIAAIADNLLLPKEVEERMRKERPE